MAPPEQTSDCSLLLIYRPRNDERLIWPSWLTCSGQFTRTSGHPSEAGRAQDRESSPAEDRRSTTVPRHQPSEAGIVFNQSVISMYVSLRAETDKLLNRH